MSTTDLLFELGTEELPAGELDSMVTALYEGILNGLKDEGLPFADAQYFSTPRRLAVLVREVAVKGPDIQRSVVGPPLSAAQDSEGKWTKAAEGFARKQGVALDALAIVEEQGVARIVAHVSQKGADAEAVIPDIVARSVMAIPVSNRKT